MILEMPEIPTAEKVRSMTDLEYNDIYFSFNQRISECIGAIAALKCDLFDISFKNKGLSSKITEITSYYENLMKEASAVVDWLLKVRHFGYKEDFQK